MKHLIAVLLVAIFSLIVDIAWASPTERIVVKYKTLPEPAFALHSGEQSIKTSNLNKLNVEVVEATDGNVQQLLEGFYTDPNIAYAEVDQRRQMHELQPDDPLFSQQWNLTATGVPSAWAATVGSTEITVAVLDSGIDLEHHELMERTVSGYDFVHNDYYPQDDTLSGHGTAVAGVIAAQADNGSELAGLTWNCTIMPMKVLDNEGYGYDSDIAAAVIEAVDRGSKVINLSLGGPDPTQVLQDAIDYAYQHNVVVVASSGNNGGPVMYPAAYENVIAVGAVDEANNVPSFSCSGDAVDVVAPGVNVLSINNEPGVVARNGTSFSSPHVAGSAALLLSLDSTLSPDAVRRYLLSTAYDIEQPGWDLLSGYGIVNVANAIELFMSEHNVSSVTGRVAKDIEVGQLESFILKDSSWQVARDGRGRFWLNDIPAGNHTLAIQSAGYLESQTQFTTTAGQSIDLGTSQLAYGDINGDGQIDLYDIVLASIKVGSSSAPTLLDANGDGLITRTDVSIIAGNLGALSNSP